MKTLATLFAVAVTPAVAAAVQLAPHATLTTVYNSAYGTDDMNSVSICRNTLVTSGGYQFAAFYGVDDSIYIGRRTVGSTAWAVNKTNVSLGSSYITDDHNVVAMGVDGNGLMHLSWGMHNVPINYGISPTAVTGAGFSGAAVQFNTSNTVTGKSEGEVTYPEFYNVPNSHDLLLFYRDGGAGGGSGNGNEYIDRYNATSRTWSQVGSPMIDGISSSVNAYDNALAYTAGGKLIMTWTWRATSGYQTNHDIMYAQSLDNGATWQRQDGTPYAGPITTSTAQVVKSIPQNSSMINQSGMALDLNGNPVVGTWWAPGSIGGGTDYNRQYMLEYYDGSQWKTAQISHRTTDGGMQPETAVRDVARPIVLVDKQGRVLVVMRDEDTGVHFNGTTGYSASATGNDIVVAYSSDFQGGNPTWSYLTLSDANMGSWEPSYDPAQWAATNTLDLMYEPVGLSGETSSPISLLEWNEQAFFAATPEPGALGLLAAGGWLLVRRRRLVR